MSDCDHSNPSLYDWGGIKITTSNRLVVPGWCPNCGTDLDRVYKHEKTNLR